MRRTLADALDDRGIRPPAGTENRPVDDRPWEVFAPERNARGEARPGQPMVVLSFADGRMPSWDFNVRCLRDMPETRDPAWIRDRLLLEPCAKVGSEAVPVAFTLRFAPNGQRSASALRKTRVWGFYPDGSEPLPLWSRPRESVKVVVPGVGAVRATLDPTSTEEEPRYILPPFVGMALKARGGAG